MKRPLFLVAGVLWLLFAVGFGFFLLLYLAEGAGLQFFGWMFSSGSVLLGLVHVFGFVIAAFLCSTISASLFAHSFVRNGDDGENFDEQETALNSHPFSQLSALPEDQSSDSEALR